MAKVLVAEDEITCRMIISKAVEGMGHCVIRSSDGEHAWKTLLANPDIDLLITDVKMPGLDGRDLVKQIRAREGFEDLPIIIISGVVGPKTIAGLLEQGATWFVAKPVNPAELQEYVIKSKIK